MPDNVVVSGVTYATEDVGGVQVQKFRAGGATNATMGQAAVSTSTTTLRISSNVERRSILIRNTGTATVYIHDTSGFALVDGMPVDPGQSFVTDFVGGLYIAVASGTGTFNYWEDANA